ncbi:hypothetical protein A2U01_0111902, partial [Trifolium medium]|nr:hypothetical protein [Trifolium medium]
SPSLPSSSRSPSILPLLPSLYAPDPVLPPEFYSVQSLFLL